MTNIIYPKDKTYLFVMNLYIYFMFACYEGQGLDKDNCVQM